MMHSKSMKQDWIKEMRNEKLFLKYGNEMGQYDIKMAIKRSMFSSLSMKKSMGSVLMREPFML